MKKGELGLQRTEKIAELNERFEYLVQKVKEVDEILYPIWYAKFGVPPRIERLFSAIFKSFPENEFMTKQNYVDFCNEILEIEKIFDEANPVIREYSSDFGEISFAEFLWLAGECLEVGTYDSLMNPEYPCTSEILCNGQFSYYEVGDETNEIVIDSPGKCWDYLRENYDALED